MIQTAIASIVSTWPSSIKLYKGFAPQDATYPYATFNIVPAGMDRTFCDDIQSYTVIITVFTQSKSSSTAQTYLETIRRAYSRTSISGLIYNKLIGELVVKDDDSHFYSGSSTFEVAVQDGAFLITSGSMTLANVDYPGTPSWVGSYTWVSTPHPFLNVPYWSGMSRALYWNTTRLRWELTQDFISTEAYSSDPVWYSPEGTMTNGTYTLTVTHGA